MCCCRAQFVFMMLVLFTATLPLLVLAYIPNSVLAVVLTVVTVLTYWAVNEVARDVEDPFLFEPNGRFVTLIMTLDNRELNCYYCPACSLQHVTFYWSECELLSPEIVLACDVCLQICLWPMGSTT